MERILYIVIGVLSIFCAYRAMVSRRLLSSILYLACVSAAISVLLFMLGAQQVSVIELSVGAGLVTVLMVYALSVVGDDEINQLSKIPTWLAFGMIIFVFLLLGIMVIPFKEPVINVVSTTFTTVLWEQRELDVWIQIALIFSGVLGILGLLSEQSAAGSRAE